MALTVVDERYQRYDEAYFEDGSQRGTQYRGYKEGARRNRTYFEIAETIIKCFRPKRALEVGCATGIVVKHLNDLGIEAHGIDVSQWAIDNREHPNVILSGAESIPYDDNYFDIIYSVHSLEHLPTDIKDVALAEMTRVCRTGIQFHMLPIIGSGPYVGDTFQHLINLRSDPSHNLLFNHEWWIKQWSMHGWKDTGMQIALLHDSEHFELTLCQYILSQKSLSDEQIQRILQHNISVAYGLNQALYGKPPPGLDVHIAALCDKVRGPATSRSDSGATANHLETAAVKQIADDAERLRAAYDEILTSTSWRVTAPLRALRRWLIR